MADTKISALTALGAAPATDDLIPIVDTSASATKSMTVANMISAVPISTTLISTAFEATARLGNAGTNDATTTIGTTGLSISSAGAQNAGKTLRVYKPGALCVAGQNYVITITFAGSSGASGHNYFVGLQDAGDTWSISDSAITTSGALAIGIKGAGDGSTIDWTSINADGAGNETSNAFITNQTAGTNTTVQIVVTGTTSIKFYTNGTLVNTHTTNLPTTDGGAKAWYLSFASTNNASGTAALTVTSASINLLL